MIAVSIEDTPSDLHCWQGRAAVMNGPHQHDDIEVNLVAEAPLRYVYGGRRLEIQPGQAAVFWAATPHRLIDCADNRTAYVSNLHLPLSMILRWRMPDPVIAELLRGRPFLCRAADLQRPQHSDFTQWSVDLATGTNETRHIVLLEIQAGLRRLIQCATENPVAETLTESDDATRYAAVMARFATSHFRESIAPVDVAAAANLHPNYAMTLFHQVLGVTIGSYIARCRVTEAQRLLLTTDATTSEIAASAGFGSQSAFYATFRRLCGQPPAEYRRAYRAAGGDVSPHESS